MTTIEEQNQIINDSVKRINQARAAIYQLNKQASSDEAEKVKAAKKAALLARYQTVNNLTIHKLRLAGNEVKVSHLRYTTFTTTVGNPVIAPVPSYLRRAFSFNAKGGATYITIMNPRTGYAVTTTSLCASEDAFDYKLGVKRALDQLSADDISLFIEKEVETVA